VYTEPLLRNGLHNPVIPPLLGADDIENIASSVVACWTVFTELLPGNALIKSVTVLQLSSFILLCNTDKIHKNTHQVLYSDN
jgi:hypothetical protein